MERCVAPDSVAATSCPAPSAALAEPPPAPPPAPERELSPAAVAVAAAQAAAAADERAWHPSPTLFPPLGSKAAPACDEATRLDAVLDALAGAAQAAPAVSDDAKIAACFHRACGASSGSNASALVALRGRDPLLLLVSSDSTCSTMGVSAKELPTSSDGMLIGTASSRRASPQRSSATQHRTRPQPVLRNAAPPRAPPRTLAAPAASAGVTPRTLPKPRDAAQPPREDAPPSDAEPPASSGKTAPPKPRGPAVGAGRPGAPNRYAALKGDVSGGGASAPCVKVLPKPRAEPADMPDAAAEVLKRAADSRGKKAERAETVRVAAERDADADAKARAEAESAGAKQRTAEADAEQRAVNASAAKAEAKGTALAAPKADEDAERAKQATHAAQAEAARKARAGEGAAAGSRGDAAKAAPLADAAGAAQGQAQAAPAGAPTGVVLACADAAPPAAEEAKRGAQTAAAAGPLAAQKPGPTAAEKAEAERRAENVRALKEAERRAAGADKAALVAETQEAQSTHGGWRMSDGYKMYLLRGHAVVVVADATGAIVGFASNMQSLRVLSPSLAASLVEVDKHGCLARILLLSEGADLAAACRMVVALAAAQGKPGGEARSMKKFGDEFKLQVHSKFPDPEVTIASMVAAYGGTAAQPLKLRFQNPGPGGAPGAADGKEVPAPEAAEEEEEEFDDGDEAAGGATAARGGGDATRRLAARLSEATQPGGGVQRGLGSPHNSGGRRKRSARGGDVADTPAGFSAAHADAADQDAEVAHLEAAFAAAPGHADGVAARAEVAAHDASVASAEALGIGQHNMFSAFAVAGGDDGGAAAAHAAPGAPGAPAAPPAPAAAAVLPAAAAPFAAPGAAAAPLVAFAPVALHAPAAAPAAPAAAAIGVPAIAAPAAAAAPAGAFAFAAHVPPAAMPAAHVAVAPALAAALAPPAGAAAAAIAAAAAAPPPAGGGVAQQVGFTVRAGDFTPPLFCLYNTVIRVEHGHHGNAAGAVVFSGPQGILRVQLRVRSLDLGVNFGAAWLPLNAVLTRQTHHSTYVELSLLPNARGARVLFGTTVKGAAKKKLVPTTLLLTHAAAPPGPVGALGGGGALAAPGGAGVGPHVAAAPPAPAAAPVAAVAQPPPAAPVQPPALAQSPAPAQQPQPQAAPAQLQAQGGAVEDPDVDVPMGVFLARMRADRAAGAHAAGAPAGGAPAAAPPQPAAPAQLQQQGSAAADDDDEDDPHGRRMKRLAASAAAASASAAAAGAPPLRGAAFGDADEEAEVALAIKLSLAAAAAPPVQRSIAQLPGAAPQNNTGPQQTRTLGTINARLGLWFDGKHLSTRASRRAGHATKVATDGTALVAQGGDAFVARVVLLKLVAALVTADHPAVVPGSLAGVVDAPLGAAALPGHSAQAGAAGPSDAGAATASAAAAAAAEADLHAYSRTFVEDGMLPALAQAGWGTNASDFLVLPENARLLGASKALVRVIATMPRDADGHMAHGCACQCVHLVPVGAVPLVPPSQLAETPAGPPAVVLRMRKCAVDAATASSPYRTAGHTAAGLLGLLSSPETPKMALVSHAQMQRVWGAHRLAAFAQLPRGVTDAAAVAAALACPGVTRLVAAPPLAWMSDAELTAVKADLQTLVDAGKGKKLQLENLADVVYSRAGYVLDTKPGLTATTGRAATVECLAHATETALETGLLPLQVVARAVAEQASGDNSHPLQLCMCKELVQKSEVLLPRTLGGLLYRLTRRLQVCAV